LRQKGDFAAQELAILDIFDLRISGGTRGTHTKEPWQKREGVFPELVFAVLPYYQQQSLGL
jgi:hypothetical protein